MNEKKKYIVEGPVPKNGQELSSGGVRENGKMVEMFSNPVPYTQPGKKPVSSALSAVSVARTEPPMAKRYIAHTSFQNRATAVLRECALNFCHGIWLRVKPRLIAYASDEFDSYITEKLGRRQNDKTSTQPKPRRTTTKAEELLKQRENVSDTPKAVISNNVILFPCRQMS